MAERRFRGRREVAPATDEPTDYDDGPDDSEPPARHEARDDADDPYGDGEDSGQEPVALAHAVTTILYFAAGAGWIFIPSTVIDSIGTVVAGVISTLVMLNARGSVYTGGTVARIRRQLIAQLQPTRLTPELAALVRDEVDDELHRRYAHYSD